MSVISRTRLLGKLSRSKEYRDAYVAEHIKTSLPFQIKANRKKRGWSQAELGLRMGGIPQNGVSRLESVLYGNLTINTLLQVASGFDMALMVKLVPYSKLVKEFEDVSLTSLEVNSFAQDLPALESWAALQNAKNNAFNASTATIGKGYRRAKTHLNKTVPTGLPTTSQRLRLVPSSPKRKSQSAASKQLSFTFFEVLDGGQESAYKAVTNTEGASVSYAVAK